jgi:hypothetical protein
MVSGTAGNSATGGHNTVSSAAPREVRGVAASSVESWARLVGRSAVVGAAATRSEPTHLGDGITRMLRSKTGPPAPGSGIRILDDLTTDQRSSKD